MIKTKCIQEDVGPRDGLRILATRFRGRYLSADLCDVWMPNLGPSEKLLWSLPRQGPAPAQWRAFKKSFLQELFQNQPLDKTNKKIKNHGQKFTLRLIKNLASKQTVTLLCHCAADADYCHRFILADPNNSSKI